MYKFKTDEHGVKVFIKETEVNVISFNENPANTDFQEYQRWLALGNTPLPADEVTNG